MLASSFFLSTSAWLTGYKGPVAQNQDGVLVGRSVASLDVAPQINLLIDGTLSVPPDPGGFGVAYPQGNLSGWFANSVSFARADLNFTLDPSARVNDLSVSGVFNNGLVDTSRPFPLLQVTFTNGEWFAARGSFGVDMRIDKYGPVVDPNQSTYIGSERLLDNLILETRPATFLGDGRDALRGADFLYLEGFRQLGGIHVLEGETATFQLNVRLGSIIPESWELVSGRGFVDPSTDPSIAVSAVPEPGAAWLLLAGLGGLAWLRRRPDRQSLAGPTD